MQTFYHPLRDIFPSIISRLIELRRERTLLDLLTSCKYLYTLEANRTLVDKCRRLLYLRPKYKRALQQLKNGSGTSEIDIGSYIDQEILNFLGKLDITTSRTFTLLLGCLVSVVLELTSGPDIIDSSWAHNLRCGDGITTEGLWIYLLVNQPVNTRLKIIREEISNKGKHNYKVPRAQDIQYKYTAKFIVSAKGNSKDMDIPILKKHTAVKLAELVRDRCLNYYSLDKH